MFGYVTMLEEGALAGGRARSKSGRDRPAGVPDLFIHFFIVWNAVWLWANGPMRVPFIRWRFRGGSIA
jgi:hypothetical protein